MTDTTKVSTEKVAGGDRTGGDRNSWVWGFTPQAEIWNGRLAMIGFLAAVLIEVFANKGFLHFWGIL